MVIVVSTDGGSSSDTRRHLLAPQLLSPDGKGWGGGVGHGEVSGGVGVGIGGAVQAGFGHSRRILSVDGVAEPLLFAGDGAGTAAAGVAAAGGAAGAAAGAASAGAAGAFSPRPARELPARERVMETMTVDDRDTDTPIREARVKPVR